MRNIYIDDSNVGAEACPSADRSAILPACQSINHIKNRATHQSSSQWPNNSYVPPLLLFVMLLTADFRYEIIFRSIKNNPNVLKSNRNASKSNRNASKSNPNVLKVIGSHRKVIQRRRKVTRLPPKVVILPWVTPAGLFNFLRGACLSYLPSDSTALPSHRHPSCPRRSLELLSRG